MLYVGIKVTNVSSIDVILIVLVYSLDMYSGNDLKNKKYWPIMFLKISQKPQKYICIRVSFLMKIQAGGLQLYYKDTPDLVFLL